MIKVSIRSTLAGTFKHESSATDTEVAVSEALVQYIEQKLGFGSKNFPIPKELWTDKIQAATGSEETSALADQIILLNGLCKSALYKIEKVSVEYPFS